MTEERIGGISVGIGGSTAELEAALARAEKLVADSAARMGRSANVNISGTAGGGGRAGGGTAHDEQLVTAINNLTHQLSAGGGAGFGAAAGGRSREDDLSRAIREATEAGNTGLAQAIARAAGTSTSGVRARVESRPMQSFRPQAQARVMNAEVGQMTVTSSGPVSLDLSGFTKAVSEATESLTSLVAALSTASTAAPAGGGGSSARVSDSAITRDENIRVRVRRTAAGSARRIYEPDEGARAEATRARRTEVIAGQYASRSSRQREAPPTAAEQAILNSLFPPEPEGRQGLGRRSMQIVREPRAASNPLTEMEPAALSRQRSAAMIAAARPMTQAQRLQQMRMQAANRLAAMNAENPPTTQGPQSATVAQGRTRTVDQEMAEARRGRAPLTPEQQEAARRQREAEARNMPPPVAPYRLPSERPESARAALVGGAGSRYRPKTEEEIEREVQNRIAVRESQTVSAGRTPRTGASGLGGFFLGGGRQRIADENALSAAVAKRRDAERGLVIAEDRLRDPRVLVDARAKRHATEELTVAQNRLTGAVKEEDAARKKVASYSGLASGVRNLIGATIGGAAFGVGLMAANELTKLLESGLSPAISRVVDANTNFSASNTKVTASLAQQTAAMQGNAKGAIVSAAATADLSAAQADYLVQALSPETMVKAGTAALSQSADLFKAAAGAGTGAGVQGLVGGYGGIGGGALLGSQMGGGMGFMETLTQNMQDFATAVDKAKPTVSYNPLKQGPLGLLPWGSAAGGLGIENPAFQDIIPPSAADLKSAEAARQARSAYVANLNAGAGRGAPMLGMGGGLSLQALKPGEDAQGFLAAGRSLGDAAGTYAQEIAAAGYAVKDTFGNIVTSGDKLNEFLMSAAAGASTPDMGTLTKQSQAMSVYNENIRQAVAAGSVEAIQMQQAYQRPAFTGQLTRTTQMQTGQVNPVQAYLENLANPPIAPGAGIALSKNDSAAQQAKVNAGIKTAQGLQSVLDAYYKQGRDQIEQTYDPAILQTFGAQGVQVFNGLLARATAVSTQIAAVETGITKEQATYQTNQYNNDLRIARRSLTDILQLTGKIGSAGGDNLGVYERQNLLLGRQAQQLQFMLSQRQINFQTAIAGFQVPGLTPAEQNARVQEAKVEASFAQKQLDIQKKMFGNQVKVVDISNLRQAVDITHQISLLLEGRKVTLDTAVAQATLTRLQKEQAAIMKDVAAYTGAVDSLSSKAISDIAEQEQAVGHAISSIEQKAVLVAYNVGHAVWLGMTGGFLGSGAGGASAGFSKVAPKGKSNTTKLASGALFNTSGSTDITVGEANHETVAVLRNPRSMTMGGFGGNGGGDVVINFTATLDGAVVYRDVVRRMGRDASLRGLRSPN